jgi:hypothetical protein
LIPKYISILAIMAALILIWSVGALSIQYQQQVWAPRECGGCVEFKKLTHEFEKNVIGDPGISQGPAPHLRELLDAYNEKVVQLFFTDPWLDQVRTLLQGYEQDVLAVFQNPPEPDKQAQHDQIKEFRGLTHDFEKAVIGATQPPEPE